MMLCGRSAPEQPRGCISPLCLWHWNMARRLPIRESQAQGACACLLAAAKLQQHVLSDVVLGKHGVPLHPRSARGRWHSYPSA